MSSTDKQIKNILHRNIFQITWVDGEGNILQDVIVYISEAKSDQKTYDSRSILKLTAKKEYHNITLSCQAQNLADRSYRTAQLKLQVKFAPMVSTIKLKCQAQNLANTPTIPPN